MVIKSFVLTLGAALFIFAVLAVARPAYTGVRAGLRDENYVNSKTCRDCHADHYASWAQTYHRRMTQEARPASVQGDFERNNVYEYLGVKARMEKRGDTFSMTFTHPDGRIETHAIDRTVGSHRIEQYLTKQQGQYVRLPIAYDLVNRRWMSLNGSFFYPDNDNFAQHQTQWDSNCVFCHNVKAQPHINFQTKQFDTEVAELGIACGACHGAGAAHVDAATSPFTRTFWNLAKSDNKEIVDPLKLTAERSMMVCGHCHGQRVPEPFDRIGDILTKGDPYNAGDDLAKFYKPVWRETKVGNFSFANRFWANGSPRLTAFEYQGLLRSNCFIKGDHNNRISCTTCHTMHGGDPAGQITEEKRTNNACLSCHQKFESREALALHTKHATNSAGSSCYSCHMPRVVYGIMSVHRTHDITVPDPQLTATQAVPNACNQCHLDKSVNWSIAQTKHLWPQRFANSEPSRDEQFNIAEGARALFAGDALTRALTAEAMSGGDGTVKPDTKWAAPFLVEAFADNYPIVRFFAAQGLAVAHISNSHLSKPDYLATPEARQQSLNDWRALFDTNTRAQAFSLAETLRKRRVDVDIEVGE